MTLTKAVREQRIRLAKRGVPEYIRWPHVIGDALQHKVVVTFSGGRCSQVALWMALQYDPDIPVVFNNTGCEYAETVKHVHMIADKWRLNFTETHPKTTYWEIVKQYGFPQLRGSVKAKADYTRPRRPMCCSLLKEEPGNRFMKENGYEGIVDGIRVEESRPRALGIYQKGLSYYAERDRLWKFHPVALFSIEELMEFVKRHDIPLNPLYYPRVVNGRTVPGLDRIGCMPCTGFTSWREQLSEQNPKLFRMVNDAFQKQKGQPTLWEFDETDEPCRVVPEI